MSEWTYTYGVNGQPTLLTDKQLSDIARILERINQEHNGYGTVTIVIKRGQVAGIGSTTEHRYDLEKREEK